MTTPDGWRKSSYSGSNGGACVEIRFDGDVVRIRDSKYQGDPSAQPEIALPVSRWEAFLDQVMHLAQTEGGLPLVREDDCGNVCIRDDTVGVVLTYTTTEWAAFTAGIRSGEFARTAA
ncbi:DUF397 domain-containing protein [Nocardia cyriacigeorgica]|uniref:DUF397 domain-containing protein n=1 Tax=Nocardia cyriacigeorgica TaxID=135487 RepID=UPI00249166AB|nr:DUF397 domain-containing protein [Nocardia cyriacigeorgica]BDU04604.1 hypothetical protein FMUBM48_08670 [Nocardia cyriacigeorgica]